MTELNRFRITAMLTTDTHFQIGPLTPAFTNRNFHQGANAVLVQRLERILGDDSE